MKNKDRRPKHLDLHMPARLNEKPDQEPDQKPGDKKLSPEDKEFAISSRQEEIEDLKKTIKKVSEDKKSWIRQRIEELMREIRKYETM